MESGAYHKTGFSINPDEDGHKYWVEFEKQPSAEGVFRYAFNGILHGEGPKEGQQCVVKAPKGLYAKEFDSWVPDIEASKLAKKYAEMFNTECVPLLCSETHIEKIEFVLPLIAQVAYVANGDQSYIRLNSYVAIEPFLEGTYHKFNNNGGFEDDPEGVLLAFTHWTHVISNHKHMICDLQGVETPRGYVLTDPAVHSLEEIFGLTNLGVNGMKEVSNFHSCNIHCRTLGLPKTQKCFHVPDTSQQVHHTKYVFQVTEEEKLRAMTRRSGLFSNIPGTFCE